MWTRSVFSRVGRPSPNEKHPFLRVENRDSLLFCYLLYIKLLRPLLPNPFSSSHSTLSKTKNVTVYVRLPSLSRVGFSTVLRCPEVDPGQRNRTLRTVSERDHPDIKGKRKVGPDFILPETHVNRLIESSRLLRVNKQTTKKKNYLKGSRKVVCRYLSCHSLILVSKQIRLRKVVST